ncbi:hypothetical protein [Meridianimarinicoccus sp. MJW13]|uniref:MGH1-like glycoside hydrolase domain-containing protein n=1 Tax=Meridianimarinicoccus sp. MJW13 TaxID=2720031 RepID=UPI0018673DEB|nr:hypothetical protein [Fluviibacterium sp. MJW13]
MTHINETARQILRKNDRGGYTVPTDGLYPYQWNWDSVFAAWGFATFDNDRAWTEVETLFSGQWDDGMVPHIIFHQSDPGYFPGPDVWGTNKTPQTSGISQPPVAATLVRKIYEMDPETGRTRLAALYPRMVAWHRWWHEVRCAPGPACITHPWESGRDNCPDWDVGMANVDGSNVGPYQRRDTGHVDASMRPGKEDYDRYIAILQFGKACGWNHAEIMANGPFLMADPGITFILLRAHRDLIALGQELGEDVSEITGWADALEAAVPSIWNPDLGAYDARDIRTGTWANNLSSAAYLFLYAGIENPQMDAQMQRTWDAVTYGIPSSDPEATHFDPRRYWRGPMWPVVNSLIAVGLKDSSRDADEARLRRETATLIKKSGFYEYFDPVDGTPCGGSNFTWTAAIWLTWAGRD